MAVVRLCRIITFAASVVSATAAHGQDTYIQPDVFLQQSFPDGVPKPQVIWVIGAIEQEVRNILEHDPTELRVRYWYKKEEGRSAWILEEIGKEEPITTGIVINKGQIEQVEVLIFRESRGWEVRHDFFTDQFKGVTLNDDRELDLPIDNISGATLSVRALTRLARLALYLHNNHVAH
jgi:hypothetical protein